MTEFVVLQSGCNGITAAQAACSRHDARCNAVGRSQVVSFVICNWSKIGGNVLTNLFEIRFRESFDARCDGLVAQNQHGHIVFARDVDGFNGNVETIFDACWSEHHARRIAMASS